MTQASLFDDSLEDARPEQQGRVALTALTASGAPLNRVQKQFNTLLAKIEAQRAELAQWNALVPRYLKRMAEDVHPLHARYRERQIAMAHLFDRAIDGPGLSRAQRNKAQEILIDLLVGLIDDQEDPELIRLHDKHAAVSFEEDQRLDMNLMQAMAEEAFGIDLGDDHGAETPEALGRLIEEKVEAGHASRAEEAQRRSAAKPAKQRSAKALANEAARAQVAQGASNAVREIYRKLVSELHPDREPDPAERARKTALMQRVNQAYESRDLLVLLELQLSIQQIDAAALANVAQDRLLHYNALLREQSQRLAEEIDEVSEPFTSALGARLPRQGATDFVLRALEADVRHLREAIREIDDDLARFDDIRQLKASLKRQRSAPTDEFDLNDIEALAAVLAAGGPRRRGAK